MLISQLGLEDRKKALKYRTKDTDDLDCAFDWYKTSEGYSYWENLHDATFVENTTDKIVLSVMNDLNERSKAGLNKYGVTLDREDLTRKEWLQHAYEECLDKANYLKKLITLEK
jgi:hypothetical protein